MGRGSRAQVGDTRKAPNGYHYTRTDTGWRLTHHLTAENKIGRPLHENERVHFKQGFGRDDYANPEAVVVVEQGKSSGRRRLAQLEARRDEIQAEIDALRAELGAHADPSQPLATEALINR